MQSSKIKKPPHVSHNSVSICFFKVSNVSTRTMCEICSKINNKQTSTRRCSGVLVANVEQISNIVLLFPLLTLNN